VKFLADVLDGLGVIYFTGRSRAESRI